METLWLCDDKAPYQLLMLNFSMTFIDYFGNINFLKD